MCVRVITGVEILRIEEETSAPGQRRKAEVFIRLKNISGNIILPNQVQEDDLLAFSE